MVTKPTGRPRGRPRKQQPQVPKRDVGRPPIPLREDQNRYAVALYYALTAQGMTGRSAAMTVALWAAGHEIEPNRRFVEKFKSINKILAPVAFDKIARHGLPATFDGLAATIREKARGPWDALDGEWLRAMSHAFALTLGARNIVDKFQAVAMADAVGERDFAERVLAPMIDARIGARKTLLDLPPDYFTNFPSTTARKL